MIIFKASFPKRVSIAERDVETRVLHYLNALILNGQIDDGYTYGWYGDQIIVTGQMPKISSVSPRNNSDYVSSALSDLRKVLLPKPQWEHLATDNEAISESYESAPYLYLHASALSSGPPVCCGHNGARVPTYKITVDFKCREELYRWSVEYADHDSIWLHSGTLEKAAYRQLTSLESSLTCEGRKLCGQVEAATGKPTYYYLLHYKRSRKRESACPGCNCSWRIAERIDDQPFWQFPFKCDNCRLVSHYASE